MSDSRNLYSYNPRDLYIAYGAGLGATLVCLAIGIFALLRNGCSYTNEFSTLIRVTRDASIEGIVPRIHRSGADPLPRVLGRTRMQFHVSADGKDGFRVA